MSSSQPETQSITYVTHFTLTLTHIISCATPLGTTLTNPPPPPPPPPQDSGICLSLFILVLLQTAGEQFKSRSHSACIGAQGLRGFVPITQLNILHFYPTAWVRGAIIKLHCNLTGRCPMYIFVSHIAYFYSQNLHKFIQDSRFQNQRREGIIQWA